MCEDCKFSREFKKDSRGESWGKCYIHVEAGNTTEPMKVNAWDSCKYFDAENQ